MSNSKKEIKLIPYDSNYLCTSCTTSSGSWIDEDKTKFGTRRERKETTKIERFDIFVFFLSLHGDQDLVYTYVVAKCGVI